MTDYPLFPGPLTSIDLSTRTNFRKLFTAVSQGNSHTYRLSSGQGLPPLCSGILSANNGTPDDLRLWLSEWPVMQHWGGYNPRD
jgi:hypothetical protein